HSVLCDGSVIATCPPGTGCGQNGTCVPACQAAVENGSTAGCDYYVVAPDTITNSRGACLAAFVVNTWNAPVALSGSRGGQSFPIDTVARVPQGQGTSLTYGPLADGLLAPDEVAILFLAGYHCPASAGTPIIDAATHGTGYGQAFRITSSAPIVAFDM